MSRRQFLSILRECSGAPRSKMRISFLYYIGRFAVWRGVEYGLVQAVSSCTGGVRRQSENCGYRRQYSKSAYAPLCRRSHVLHGPAENPEIQHLARNRTVTESHLLGVCSVTDAEQNGVLLGLSPAATTRGAGRAPAPATAPAQRRRATPRRRRRRVAPTPLADSSARQQALLRRRARRVRAPPTPQRAPAIVAARCSPNRTPFCSGVCC